jgi:hypothetical protein
MSRSLSKSPPAATSYRATVVLTGEAAELQDDDRVSAVYLSAVPDPAARRLVHRSAETRL